MGPYQSQLWCSHQWFEISPLCHVCMQDITETMEDEIKCYSADVHVSLLALCSISVHLVYRICYLVELSQLHAVLHHSLTMGPMQGSELSKDMCVLDVDYIMEFYGRKKKAVLFVCIE